MNADHLHRLMASGLTGTCRQIAMVVGSDERRVRRLIKELAAVGLVEPFGTGLALRNRASGTKPFLWRAAQARVLTEAA